MVARRVKVGRGVTTTGASLVGLIAIGAEDWGVGINVWGAAVVVG